MDARETIAAGIRAECELVVAPEQTVAHFLANMPMVFATPMMIMQMELAAAEAVLPYLQPGWVTVGAEVNVKHLAASPVGAVVRTTAEVIAVERRIIRFHVASFCGTRTIGEGFHARGLVNVENFNKRLEPAG